MAWDGWRWRERPYGPCPRCQWPANTLGPNGSPWHALCWNNADPAPSWNYWMLRVWREEQEAEREAQDG